MEGSSRAVNHRQYQQQSRFFAEGIARYVEHTGSLYDCLLEYRRRLMATLITTGVCTIRDFHNQVVLELVFQAAGVDNRVCIMLAVDCVE